MITRTSVIYRACHNGHIFANIKQKLGLV